ncbi:MAG: hypothetical protein EOO24_11525 [Comamonadaceae bacterium]|nr:MAG: hypothetical protein EOO24_11525 [Comamonadaceae bacterium]
MLMLVLRGFVGTAMAAGVLAPLQLSASVQQPSEHGHANDHGDHGHAAFEWPSHTVEHAWQGIGEPMADGAEVSYAHHALHGATPAHPDFDESTEDCAEHAHHSSTCSACEICHSAILDGPNVTPPAHSMRTAALPAAAANFHSAPAALAIKPPIA